MTFCKHCGPTGSTLTVTVPYTVSATPTGVSGQSEGSGSSGVSETTSTATLVVVPHPSSKPIKSVSSIPYSATWTPSFAPHPTGTGSASGTQGGVSPIYTGAASRSGVTNCVAIFMTTLAACIVFF